MTIRGIGGLRGQPAPRMAHPAVAAARFAALVLVILATTRRRR